MIRKRTGAQWNAVLDPLSPLAINGLVWTDYPLSPLSMPLINSLPEAALAIDVDAQGKGAVCFRRPQFQPFGLRGFDRSPSGYLVPQPAAFTWLPAPWAAGFGSYDLKVLQDGRALVLWEGTSSTQGGPGWAYLSLLDLEQNSVLQESLFDSLAGQTITSLSLGVADTGHTAAAVSRGAWPTLYRAHLRTGDLHHLARVGPVGQPALSFDARGFAGLPYHIWPLASAASSPLLLPDGRKVEISLLDPLLNWHLQLMGPNPIMPLSLGTLDASGKAVVPLAWPSGIPSMTVQFLAFVLDPALGFPEQVRMFTRPTAITLP
jgi:hypothetical protein